MIKFDVSTTSVIVTCTLCPHWYAFAWDKDRAYTSGADHRVAVHGVTPGEAKRAAAAATRRAARTVTGSPEHRLHGTSGAARTDA